MPNTTAIPVREIPGCTRFSVRGQSLELDLLTEIYFCEDLASEINAHAGNAREYLSRFRDHILTETGVELSLGEADWLHDQLEIEFVAAKKKRREAIADALSSRSSTASTPAD